MTIFHNKLLSNFRDEMYETLLYEDHLATDTARNIEFKDEMLEAVQGFLLHKDKLLYLIHKESIDRLPLRVLATKELITKDNKVVLYVKNAASFKIIPSKEMSFREMIDLFDFKHSLQDEYTLWKIVCLTARLDRVALRVSSNPNWGKTSSFELIRYLLDKSYVIRPKSIPGICRGITKDGVLVLDEMGKLPAEAKNETESVLYQLGGMSNSLTIGTAGSLAYKTKSRYDVSNLSIVCMYNLLGNYGDKDHFFDYMFSNPAAINDRFLPLKLGKGQIIQEQFIKEEHKLTPEIKDVYQKIMKTYAFYHDKSHWKTLIDNAFIDEQLLRYKDIKGRHLKSFRTLLCGIALYTEQDKEMFCNYAALLYRWYKDYMIMIKPEFERLAVKEEDVV